MNHCRERPHTLVISGHSRYSFARYHKCVIEPSVCVRNLLEPPPLYVTLGNHRFVPLRCRALIRRGSKVSQNNCLGALALEYNRNHEDYIGLRQSVIKHACCHVVCEQHPGEN